MDITYINDLNNIISKLYDDFNLSESSLTKVEYDKFKLISIKSLGGDHVLQSNNHITKIFFILTMVNGKIEVEYQHIKTMLPAPIDILSDTTIIKIYADSGTATITDRIIL